MLVLVPHKRRATKVLELIREGAETLGVPTRTYHSAAVAPVPGEVGVFFGVNPDTRPIFDAYAAAGRALYVDNGWFSSRGRSSFRVSWNGVQPRYEDLRVDYEAAEAAGLLRQVHRRNLRAVRTRALLCLQSSKFFGSVAGWGSRGAWVEQAVERLTALGYSVTLREKPSRRVYATPLYNAVSVTDVVVSLSSTASLKAAMQGCPAYCLAETTMSRVCPTDVPPPHELEPASRTAVCETVARLITNDYTMADLRSGRMLEDMLNVDPSRRVSIPPPVPAGA